MFRLNLSKFKQVFTVAIIPRIFVRETKPIKSKLNNNTLDVFNFARKSTDSGSKDDEIEKQRQIIEKCFVETHQASESKDLKDDSSEMEGEHKNIESSDHVRLSDAEKCDIPNASDNEPSHATSGMQAEDASVRATTANLAEETLDQKLETIHETPNVEASPQKIEGFNSTPKVLGHNIEFFADEKIQKIDLDDLAKRCVGAPIGNIDEMLIKEMKNMASNDVKIQPDMNFIKSHGVEKYYSGIFEHFSEQTKKTQEVDDAPKEPINLFDENTSIEDQEIKSERITPLHVDAVHLFALDEGSRDYKDTGFLRESPVYSSSEVEEPLLDLPNIITPYESPVMPFYEYVNKEEVFLKDFEENETITVTETATDTESVADIPRPEEVLLKKEDTEVPNLVVEKQEMDPDVSQPTLSHIVKPNLENNLKEQNIKRGFGNLSRERLLKLLYLYKGSPDKKTAESHVFSTTTDIPPPPINPSPNSSISGTATPEVVSKEVSEHMEMPPDSAISANQNPGEYYNMMGLNEEQTSILNEQMQTLTADNRIIHAFCAQLQEMKDVGSKETEDSIMPLEYPVILRDPFSYVLIEPEIKKNSVTETFSDKVNTTTVENFTDNIRNEDTNTDESLPLSQVLKRIRNKNRLELCRNFLLENAKLQATQKFTCVASTDSNKPKNCPPPCQPPPKPPKEKCPKPCPPPCPPKKDPCAKLIPFFLNTIIRVDVPFDLQIPIKQYNCNYYYNKSLLTDDILERLHKLGETLQYLNSDQDTKYIKDATCAREFEPWIPIPSWPAPKVEKKRPFVCPKEGCKQVPVPRSNPPKQEPCLGVPKKLFSFSQACLSAVNTPDIIFIQL